MSVTRQNVTRGHRPDRIYDPFKVAHGFESRWGRTHCGWSEGWDGAVRYSLATQRI